jgi:coproporphyrinogen III oxidase
MSLPPQANWVYDFKPKPDSEEEKTMMLLKKGINWSQINKS